MFELQWILYNHAMKYILLIAFLVASKCNSVKGIDAELTTHGFDIVENETDINNHNIATDKVVLDDVIFLINKQNWTNEEKPCLDNMLRMLHGLQNFTLWAVWDWDAQASQPQGLLFGNKYQLGNFDQCMSAPWASKYPELRTKYCLADIQFERTDKEVRKKNRDRLNPYQSALDFMQYRPPHTRALNELTWGACVPLSCHPKSVKKLMSVMLDRSHLGTAGMKANIAISENDCQNYDDDAGSEELYYAFVGMFILLLFVTLLCTYLNYRTELDTDQFKTILIKAFCMKENAKSLLKVQKGETLKVLYGIRFLTICLIVLDHQTGISNAGPISDGYSTDQLGKTVLGLMMLHNDLFVDTFFFLSGFLTVINLVKVKRLPNPIILIVKRYVRLVVALAVVVFFVCAVLPYWGSGPLWIRAVRDDMDTCKKNWWLNLLMINNYIDSEHICIVASWYIPCDFHFFVVTLLLYCLYKKFPRLGLVCAVIITVAAVITPGILNYLYKFAPVQLFTYNFVANPRGSESFHVTYIKSHTRYAAYLIGFFAGYFYSSCFSNDNCKKISKKWASFGCLLAIVLMIVMMISGSSYLLRDYHPLEGAVYAALNRPVWAFAVAVLVLCCSIGTVPLVKGFLSWYPWVPLSRMAYGIYLTHTVIITRNIFSSRNPQHNDMFETINSATGVIGWSCLAALLLWLLAEAPANNLLSIILKSQIKKSPEKQQENGSSPRGASSISTSPMGSGHLQENMSSTTIHFSSKM